MNRENNQQTSRKPGSSGTVAGPESGSVALFLIIILALAGLPMAGLIWDGGTALAARGRAADLAAQAARAGADAISVQSLHTGDPADLRIDPIAAQAAGRRLLTAAGATGTISVIGADTVRVSAHVPARAAILSAVGIHDISGNATAQATILHGITTVAP